MASSWSTTEKDPARSTCELWAPHKLNYAENLVARERQTRSNPSCWTDELWCLRREHLSSAPKACSAAQPLWVQPAHFGRHHVRQGRCWSHLWLPECDRWRDWVSNGQLTGRAQRRYCCPSHLATFRCKLELMGWTSNTDASWSRQRIPCRVCQLPLPIWRGTRGDAIGSTLERWKVWESRWALEGPLLQDSQIQSLNDVILATSIVTQTRNSFPRFNGYSPMQWVLGVGDLKLPGSLLDGPNGGSDPNLEVMEASMNPQGEMARTLAVRESARVADPTWHGFTGEESFAETINSHLWAIYPVGAYVYFLKAQKPQDDQRNYRWFGPARVIRSRTPKPRRWPCNWWWATSLLLAKVWTFSDSGDWRATSFCNWGWTAGSSCRTMPFNQIKFEEPDNTWMWGLIHDHLERCLIMDLLMRLFLTSKKVMNQMSSWTCRLRATTACTFSTSQLPKVAREWCVLYILTWKCALRHNGVHFFDISTSKSGPELRCFVHFDLEMCFAPQRPSLFRHLNFQKSSDTEVFCTFWLPNVLRATMACTFSTSQLPKVVWTCCVLYILTWKCASRHNGVQFFITHLASWLHTRRFSEPTCRPSGATNHWKNTVFRDFPTFSRICIFFLLTLSLLLFFLLIFLFSLPLPCSAFHLSILSEVWLLNFLRLYYIV